LWKGEYWPYINEITQHAKEIRHITTYHRS
jgi:hypothetical protein